MNAVTQTEGTSLIVAMASRYSMDPVKFQQTIRATCLPNNVSVEDFAAFVMIAKEYDLNPILREIFAYPKPGGGLQVVVSVDGWAKLINRQPLCDGVEFDDHPDDSGGLASITCRIYRKDRSRPTTATEYMAECRQNSSVWQKWPRRMLRHKALIQCARYAFGFSGIVDQDEAERYIPAARQEVASPPAPLPTAPLEAPVPPEPPAPPSPTEPITVIDGDIVVDAVQEPEEIEAYADINEFFDELDASLGAEQDEEGIEARWEEYSPHSIVRNQADTNIVDAIRARHLRRVAGKK